MTTIAEEFKHGDQAHDHPKFLAHHFDTPQQQFDSGKLGIWLFLTTEILLFSGLFCAYAVYRANHPEIFAYAHLYLNKWLGALNTMVLIFSSFTMAWGVRAAQLGQRKLCVGLLGITIICGMGFLCIKGVEYGAKIREGVLPPGPNSSWYNPKEAPGETTAGAPVVEPAGTQGASVPQASVTAIPFTGPTTRLSTDGVLVEQSAVPKAALGPAGVSPEWNETHDPRDHIKAAHAAEDVGSEPENAHIFFSIYFLMTGLHGLHVMVGMCLIGWVMFRANRGDFSPEYFSPVDFVGLYWHIVDLIWIFLFPLLYLIGNRP